MPKPRKVRFDKQIVDFTVPQIKVLSSVGCSMNEMSQLMGISPDAISRRFKEKPEFSAAFKQGKVEARQSVRHAALTMARSGKCWQMTQFYLKCKDNWKDRQEIGISYLKDNFGTEDVTKLTNEQAVALAEKCLERLKSKPEDENGE